MVNEILNELIKFINPIRYFFLQLPNYNPNHFKHYKKTEMIKILSSNFSDAEVKYGIQMGKYWINSMRSWSLKRPLRLIADK